MNTNLHTVSYIVKTVENDLSRKTDIDSLADELGYSPYHIQKMFTGIVGMSLHNYVKSRRLSEAVTALRNSDSPISAIALDAGYESQQSFTDSFKKHFRVSPGKARSGNPALHLTPPFRHKKPLLPGDLVISKRVEDLDSILLAGFSLRTMKGFLQIPRLWSKLHKVKQRIPGRKSQDLVYALHDYHNCNSSSSYSVSFDYLACIDLADRNKLPTGMTVKELPPSRYVIFSFSANPRASVEHLVVYIYREWFPAETVQLNRDARYELVRYSEDVNSNGDARIEILIPIE